MVQRIIGVTDLQRRFKSVFDEVAEEGIPYVLTRGSRPEAALVPYEEYRKLQESKEREVLFEVDRLLQRRWEASEEISEEEVAVDVRAARDEARKR
jgi:prevent-host-death family protein